MRAESNASAASLARYVVVDDPAEGADELTVAAFVEGKTVGIGIAVFDGKERRAHVQSLLVVPEAQGRGLGQGLLANVEAAAKARGMTSASCMFEVSDNIALVEHGLTKAGYTEPLPGLVICRAGPVGVVLQDPWWSEPLPDGYEVFSWSELTEAARAALAGEEPDVWFPGALSPFPERPVDLDVSVGVRSEGEVIGWLLAHRTPDTILYGRLFIRSDLRRGNLATLLLGAGLQRQALAGVEIGEFAVRSNNHPMLGFMEHRLARHVFEKKEVRHFEKPL